CAQGMVRERASHRLADLGYHGDEQERILDAIPIATHNQRADAELLVGSAQFIPAEELIEIAEASMSAPILALLKRPDELHVVEQAHLHPMFVEDSVRAMIHGVIERYPELEDEAFVSAHQINFETIHNHDVVAERTGTLGELRDQVLHDGNGGTHVTLDGWLAQA
ncbi:MAG TPA: GTP cyclohydrolase, FolE2/MptA family, partial [Gaiellales bacterium]